MRKNIVSGVIFGAAGGLMTFIFGGWAVAMLGIFMGIALGFILSSRQERKEPLELARQALTPFVYLPEWFMLIPANLSWSKGSRKRHSRR